MTRRVASPGALVALAPILILAAAGCAPAGPAGQDRPATHEVTIRAMRFEPADLRAAVGDTVRWRNADLVPHTVTAGAFDSGDLPADSAWMLVVDRPGPFDYACRYHPTMTARLTAVAP